MDDVATVNPRSLGEKLYVLWQRALAVGGRLSRPTQIGLLASALAALVVSYAAMCFVYCFVYGAGSWATGLLVGAVARAMNGGSYYEGGGSLLGPTWPYFPFSVLVTHAVAKLGAPLVSLPPILGGLSAFLLPFVSAAFARSLGARWLPSLIASFVLYGLLLPHYRTFVHIGAAFFPDACIPLFALLSCIAVAKMEDSGPRRLTMVGFGLALVAAGLSKQVGFAPIVSSVVYLAFCSPMPKRTRWIAIGVAMAAAVAVLGVVLGIPHCFEVTVGVMSHHHKDWRRTTVIWDYFFADQLPAVVLSFVAFSAAACAKPLARRRVFHLSTTLAIVFAVQILATVKDGGGGESGSYNMEMVMSLAIPVAAWAWASPFHRESSWAGIGVLLAASLFCTKGLLGTREKIWSQRAASWEPQRELLGEFTKFGKHGDALAPTPHFWALYSAGCRLTTAPEAMWHFASADPAVKDPTWLSGVERAIREQQYTLITPNWTGSLPEGVRRRLSPLISENYGPTAGTSYLVPKGRR
jgi:hypothetical protein